REHADMDGYGRGSRRPLTAVDEHAEGGGVESAAPRRASRGVSVRRTRSWECRDERAPLIMTPTKRTVVRLLAGVLALSVCWSAAVRAQGTTDPTNQLKVLRAAASALGQIRMSDIGMTNPPLPPG